MAATLSVARSRNGDGTAPAGGRPCEEGLGSSPPSSLPKVRITETNWDLFRLFFAVVRTGSVNRAARDLGMSQPTLSRRLKELESSIGAPLLFRVASGVKLTEEGDALLRSAEGMLQAFELFHRDMSRRVSERSHSVKISATEGMTKHWLLPHVKKLRALNNEVRFEITSTIQQQNLAGSDLDFAIRMGHTDDNELIGRRVGTVAFGIFASETYLAEHPAPRSIAELVNHDFIVSSDDFAGFRSERSGQMGLYTQFRAVAESRSALKMMPIASQFAAAAQGLGLAFLAVPFAQAEGLVRVLPQESSSLDLWLLRRRESDLRKLTRHVRRYLESEFADSRAWFQGHQERRRQLQRIA